MNDKTKTKKIAPVLTLMMLAPLIAEILPGATRFSSIFVFPIEICVWGGGSVLIRHLVRKGNLGWQGMLFLALALSVAEEFIIQQTSVAPLIIQFKGVTYARAFDINYVYLIWALIYETVFVVFLPVYITELIYPRHKIDVWVGKKGVIILIVLFFAGSILAWYTWTRIARVIVFHKEAYTPSLALFIIALILIVSLILIAFRYKNKPANDIKPVKSPAAWVLGISGFIWAVILYGIVVLAFGAAPQIPPFVPVMTALLLALTPVILMPRFMADKSWTLMKSFSVASGIISGSMVIGFIGFLGTINSDLIFKIVINLVALVCMAILWTKERKWGNLQYRI